MGIEQGAFQQPEITGAILGPAGWGKLIGAGLFLALGAGVLIGKYVL